MEPNQLMETLLQLLHLRQASDLHLSCGAVPALRIDGELQPLMEFSMLTDEQLYAIARRILPEHKGGELAQHHEIDFSFEYPGIASRFRANLFYQERGLSISIRQLAMTPPTLEQLAAPTSFSELCKLQNGLVLVTGPTGSGKSTTLAAMINYLNQHYTKHILTIEDPIEYLHKNQKALIQQRELGKHTASFTLALRAALREDPDYLLIGEMRDLETIRLALTAAETGHLVFATLHTNSAAETIDRIVNAFPAAEKALIRAMLAVSLRAVISQHLLKKIGGGRVAVHEIMICTPAIKNLIREDKGHQIYSAIQMGKAYGMQTLADSVRQLIKQGIIDPLQYAHLVDDG